MVLMIYAKVTFRRKFKSLSSCTLRHIKKILVFFVFCIFFPCILIDGAPKNVLKSKSKKTIKIYMELTGIDN